MRFYRPLHGLLETTPHGVFETTNVLSGHGTLIARAPTATPTVFTTIAELGDVTPPELHRNEFDASSQQDNIDSYILGMLRRGQLKVPLNFIPTNATHDHLTGLYKALNTEPPPYEGYKLTYPEGTQMVFSGQVQSIIPTAPVDGKLSAQVTIRLSGRMSIAGVSIG